MERLTYDYCVMNAHCWQVKGADNLECREVCENQEDRGAVKNVRLLKHLTALQKSKIF